MTADERVSRIGIGVGFALVILGIGAYVLTDFESVTALIPAIFGIAFVTLGRLVPVVDREAAAVYALGGLAILGIAGTARGLSDLVALASGEDVDSAMAVGSQAAMAILCLVVLVVAGLYAVERR